MHSGEISSREEGEGRIAHTQRRVKIISNSGLKLNPLLTASAKLRARPLNRGCIFTLFDRIALLQALKVCWIHFLPFTHLYTFVQEQSFATAGLAPSMLLSTIVELLCRS
jgi:hypothetical protein